MHRTQLLKQLEEYSNAHPQEHATLSRFIEFVNAHERCFDRSTCGHITSSIWIVNTENTHALLTHHKKLNIWVQLGGHNDGESDCKKVAVKEAEEESGIKGFTFLHESILDIDIHAIPSSCEYHYDVRYLLQAPKNAAYTISEESNALAWVPFDTINTYSKESSVLRMNEKALKFFKR